MHTAACRLTWLRYLLGSTALMTSLMSRGCMEYVTTQTCRLESSAARISSRKQGRTCSASFGVPCLQNPAVWTDTIVLSKSSASTFTPLAISSFTICFASPETTELTSLGSDSSHGECRPSGSCFGSELMVKASPNTVSPPCFYLRLVPRCCIARSRDGQL